jgi:hypothetical protein
MEESNIAPTWLMDLQHGSPVAQKSPLDHWYLTADLSTTDQDQMELNAMVSSNQLESINIGHQSNPAQKCFCSLP